MRRIVLLLALLVVSTALAAPLAHGFGSTRPVPGPVLRGFSPPPVDWLPGHRGVDLAARPGEPVRVVADGVVTFAGPLAGRGVVVVQHGELRTTYEPVVAVVRVGEAVSAGSVIGRVGSGGHCDERCLHLGLRRGETYLDPLGAGDVLLLPADAVALARRLAADRLAAARLGSPTGSGVLLNPVAGRIGSPFGRRFHPIFREWRLHAGVDLSAACGTPIRAAADGVVRSVSYDRSGGHRLVLAHAAGLTTHYLHARGYRVRTGQRVARGQVVGTVGSTGWSTGCHLHLGVKRHGVLIDPATLL
jgi:murein DD-endopeptidase MepM/ murein hydrolase activator NlpD